MFRNAWPCLLLIALGTRSLDAADWPAFRGPSNNGIAAEGETAPVDWGPEKNIRWKVSMPQPGNSSPIVVGRRLFIASSEDEEGLQRSLYCFDADDGNKLWTKTVPFDRVMPIHKTTYYCASTPACDGKRVVVWHGSAGLHCYDVDGRPLWSRDLGEFRHMYSYASSPVLHKGRVILHAGPGKRVFVTAIDLATGKTLWETDEAGEGSDRNKAGKPMGSWTTPLIVPVEGGARIIVSFPLRVVAYDADSGKIVWTCGGNRHVRGDMAYSSPVFVGGNCFVTGGFRGVSMAIRLGGSGDVTRTHRLFRIEDNPQNIGSAVATGGYVYRANAWGGTLDCVDPATGKLKWSERGKDGDYWASVVMVDGLLYATSQKGTTIVYKPNPKQLEIVAANQLNETCQATPAVADGRIFIRTMKHLYCIGD